MQKYKLQSYPAPAKEKKKKASKHNRHLNKTHTITLRDLLDLNKENARDLEILLSDSLSQLSWSVKGGDGIGYVLLPLCMVCVRLPAICYSRVEFPAAQPCPGFLSFCQPSLQPQKAVDCCTTMYLFLSCYHIPKRNLGYDFSWSHHTVQILHQEQLGKKSLRFLHSTLLVRLLPHPNPVNSSLHLPPSWFSLVAVTDCTSGLDFER